MRGSLSTSLRQRPARPSGRPGQATVEFAMVILFGFLPMILGTIELGRGVWYYNQLSQLSREGARALVVSGANYMTPGDPSTQKQYVLTGNWPGTYTVASCGCASTTAVGWIGQMDVGIPTDQVTVTIQIQNISSTANRALEPANRYTYGLPATVQVSYPYQPIVATFLGIPATITLQAQTVMQMQ